MRPRACCPAVLPDLGPAATDLVTRITERLRSPVRFVTLHGDLHPGQLVVGEMGVGLIDLDEVSSGAAVSDLASLAAGLLAHATTGHVAVATARHLCDDVVEGYAREAGGVPAGLDTWVAAHLLRRAPQAFRERHAAWPDVVARTLDLAGATLDTPRWPECARVGDEARADGSGAARHSAPRRNRHMSSRYCPRCPAKGGVTCVCVMSGWSATSLAGGACWNTTSQGCRLDPITSSPW